MKNIEKNIFIILLMTIIILLTLTIYSIINKKYKIEILTKLGNDIIKNIDKKSNINIEEKKYETEKIKINYPYIEKLSDKTNKKIKEKIFKNINTSAKIKYEIKISNEKIISILFYGTKDENNYNEVININPKTEKFIKPIDIFINKNKPISILKSEYLEKQMEIDYLDSKTYIDLLKENIEIYFTKEKLGIINTPQTTEAPYINIEIEYNNLKNNFIEEN